MKFNVRSLIAGGAAVAALTLGACSFGGNDAPQPAADIQTTESGSSLAAIGNGDSIDVFNGADGDLVRTFDAQTEYGSPTSFLVIEDAGDWLHVLLPERPNGSTGWVRAESVSVDEVHHQILVDRSSNTLRVEEDGEVILEVPVADGSETYPTPSGNFYVTDVLETGNDSGAYGPYALGISAHSDVLTEFNGSDGQVGIHGTNNPDSIGQDVSHGCIRLDNDTIAHLASFVPLGTPVQIV